MAHRASPFRSMLAALAAVTALLLTGCSGSSTDGAGGGSSGTARGGGPGGGAAAANLPPCPLDALGKAGAPVEVVVWHTLTAKPLETLQALVETYNGSQTKVKVRLESQGSTYDEIQAKFNASVASKQLPAVVVVDDTFTQSMADSGVILPAQSCIDADKYDTKDLRKVAVDYYTIDGVLWPASANIGSVLLFYNRDHFRKAGLDPDKPPTTLAELRAASEKIKQAGVVDKPLVHELGSWKTEFFLTGAHASVVDNDNGRGTGVTSKATLVGNDKALELFRWMKKMKDDGLMDAVPYAPAQIGQYLAMGGRKSSMLIESSSAATSIEAFLKGNLDTSSLGNGDLGKADASGLEVGAAVMPGFTEPGRTQMGGGAWYLTNTVPPEQQAAAWDFMKFLNSDESQAKLLMGGSSLPFRVSTDSRADVKEFYAKSLSGRWLQLASDQVNKIDPAFPGPLIGPYDQVRVAIQKASDNLLVNGMSPEDALSGAQSEIDKLLAQYNKDVH